MVKEVSKSIAAIRETHLQMSQIEDYKLLEGMKLIYQSLLILLVIN